MNKQNKTVVRRCNQQTNYGVIAELIDLARDDLL